MVRKQVYIHDDHEVGLKQRAADTGLSEAEIIRRALDAHLDGGPVPARGRGRGAAVAALDAHADRIAARLNQRAATAAEWTWNRAELYDEREARYPVT